MALPPLNAAPAVPTDDDMPPGGAGAGADDTMGADDSDQPQVFATIMKTPDGKFILIDGDEPEDGEMGDGESGMMDQGGVDGPTLLKQLMAKMEGDDGAEQSFGKAFRGEPDATTAGPAAPMKPPMKKMAA